MRRRWKWAVGLAAAVALAAGTLAGVAVWWRFASSGPPAPSRKVEPSPTVLAAGRLVVKCLGGPSGRVEVRRVDVRRMTAGDFRRWLEDVRDEANGAAAALWMPGDGDWFVAWRTDSAQVSLADMLDVFAEADEAVLAEAGCDALASLFASYVGLLPDVFPAFEALDPQALVAPENFVTRDVPELTWLNTAEVDEDILRRVREEVRSAQVVRRVVLEGCILSRRGEAEKAVEAWARAAKRNPSDPMILERLERLSKNAQVFEQIGKFAAAVKCYETMALIRPNDPTVLELMAACLVQLRQDKLAQVARNKAKALRAAP